MKAMLQDLEKLFENQRRNNGIGHGTRNEMNNVSKVGMVAVVEGHEKEVTACDTELLRLWTKLKNLDLPADIAWSFKSEAAQEMEEFFVVAETYPLLEDEAGITTVLDVFLEGRLSEWRDLGVSPQAGLAGIGDAISELGKMMRVRLLDPTLTRKKRIELRQRFLFIAGKLYEFLRNFETVVPMVINNTRRKGYGNTYRGMLGRIEGLIARQQEELIRFYEQEGGVQ